MKKFVLAFLLLTAPGFALDACVPNSVTILNSTAALAVNSILNYSVICFQTASSTCNINLTLLANTSFDETTNPCNVHIKAAYPSDYYGPTNTTPKCTDNITLVPGLTYNRFDSQCDLSFQSILPGTVDLNQYIDTLPKCIINDVITPEFQGNYSYMNKNGTCNINLSIQGLSWPNGTIPIEVERLLMINENAAKCTAILEKTQNENVTFLTSHFADLLANERIEVRTLNDIIDRAALCTISDQELLKAMKKLPSFQKRYLQDFARLYGTQVTYQDFTQVVQADYTNIGDALFTTRNMLNDYAEAGVAAATCQKVFNPTYNRNETDCTYTPRIIPSCLNRTSTLLAIDDESYWNGFSSAGIIAGILLAFIVILAYLHIKYPGVFPGI